MLRTLMLYLIIQILTLPVFASDTATTVETLKMGVLTTPRLPYWGGSPQLPSGLVHDITSAMASDLHINIEYVGYDTVEALHQAVNSNQVDLALRYRLTQGDNLEFLFSEPIYEDLIVGWVAPLMNEPVIWGCLEDSIFCQILAKLNLNFVEVNNTEQFYQRMFEGDINASIGLYRSFLYYFRNNNFEEEKITFNPQFGSAYSAFIFNKNNSYLKSRVDSFILSFRKNNDIKTKSILDKKYGIYEGDFYNKGKKTLRYSLSDDSFPYSYYDEELNRYRGAIHDIFRRITAITPMEFEFVPSNGESLENMLKSGVIDFIPIVKRGLHDQRYFAYTKDFIDVDFILIENIKRTHEIKIGILDRFGFSYQDKITDEYIIYNNSEELFSDLIDGKLSNAYVNRHLLESIYIDKLDFKFRVIQDINNLDLDIKSPMLIRHNDQSTKEILEESFKIFTHEELSLLLNRYSKVDYKIGYHKDSVLYLITSILLFTLIISLSYLIYARKLKKKADGADKKNIISEAQIIWLVKIIDNIPNAVCIRNTNQSILLSNSQFKNLKCILNYENDVDLLDFILKKTGIESHEKSSKDIHIIIENNEKHYNVSNDVVPHYIDKTILEMIVITDITAQKDKEKVLIQLHKEANKSLNLKKNFLAIISHELRTPISGIVGIIELLDSRIKDKINKDLLRNAAASSNKLKLLVDDILDFSKIDAEQLKISPSYTNLAIELSPILKNFESLANKKNLQFKVNWKPSKNLIYYIDTLRLTQIISNLLSNAIKFTDEGIVSIKIETQKDTIKITVKDSGIGMTTGEQKRIFDPFVQAQDNISRKYGGTGLGMSIVKNLIELMGGSISIVSSYGVGTTININIVANSIPLHHKYSLENHIVDNQSMADWLDVMSVDYVSETVLEPQNSFENFYPDSVIEILSDKSIAEELALPSQNNLYGTVLVVDDDPLNRYLVKMQLESLKVNARLVSSGNEALKELTRDPNIHAIITDYHMPEMNGLELAKQIRYVLALNDLPIVICTADHSEEVKSRAISKGVNAVIHKPYTLEELARQLTPFLTVHELNKAQNEQSTLRNWFDNFDKKNHTVMAEALISSLKTSLKDLSINNKTKEVTHRLKGTAGSFGQSEIVELCNLLELDPENSALRSKLIHHVERVLSEARTIQNN